MSDRPNLLNHEKRLRRIEEELAYPVQHAIPNDVLDAIILIGKSVQKQGAQQAAEELERKYLPTLGVVPSGSQQEGNTT